MDRIMSWCMNLSVDLRDADDDPLVDSIAVMGRALDKLIPSDSGGLTAVDIIAHRSTISGNPKGPVEAGVLESLTKNLNRHPLVSHIVGNSSDLSPRRMSDLLSMQVWSQHPVFLDLFSKMGTRYQMGIPATPILSGRGGSAWALNRSTADFTDFEVDLARMVQPVLLTLTVISSSRIATRTFKPEQEAVERHRLTSRELEMIRHLADGLSARQMATATGISIRTVHKHLENIYDKLNCHDRLMVVSFARRFGLLPVVNVLNSDQSPHLIC